MSEWDVQRDRKVGRVARPAPRCSECGKVSVFDPCRDCMSDEEAAELPPDPRLDLNAQ